MSLLLPLLLVLLLLSTLSQAVPIAYHQLYIVNASSYTIVKARAFDNNNNIDNNMRYMLQTAPASGKVLQLSKVFSDYGYEPVFGSELPAGRGAESEVKGSGQRFIYRRPALDVARNRKWDSVKIRVFDGVSTSVDSIYTFVPPSGAFVGSDFFLDNEGWSVVGNKNSNGQPAQFEGYNRGPSLSNYIVGSDNLINLDRRSKVDSSLWYFRAPANYYENHGLAYGGWLSFTLSSFSGDFSKQNRADIPLVKLECASCLGPVSQGITLIYPLNNPRVGKYNGETRTFQLPLLESDGWLKDPQNTLLPWRPASQCDLIQVLSRLSVSI